MCFCSGFSANLAFFDIGDLAWRVQVAAACIPAVPLLCLIFVCPGIVPQTWNRSVHADKRTESPRFLIKKNNLSKAYTSLCYLNETPLQAARELYYISAQIQAEKNVFSRVTDMEDLELRSQPSRADSRADTKTYKSNRTSQSRHRVGGFWTKIWQLFSVPRIRRAAVAAFVVMISQQLCGVNVIGIKLYHPCLDFET